MAKTLFDTSSWTWNGDHFPEYMGRTMPEGPCSKYGTVSGAPVKVMPTAKLNAYTLRAMFGIIDAEGDGTQGFGFAKTSTGAWLAIVPEGAATESFRNPTWYPETKTIALYNPTNGKLAAAHVPEPGTLEKTADTAEVRIAVMMAVMLEAITSDDEARECWNAFNDGPFFDPDERKNAACTLSDNVYRRVTQTTVPEDVKLKVNMDTITVLTNRLTGRMNVLYGTEAMSTIVTGFTVTDSIEGTAPKAEEEETEAEEEELIKARPETIAELKGFYSLYPYRVLSEEEEALVPEIPETYQITDQIIEICELAKRSTGLPTPIRNFMFVGGAGSGKTEAVKMIAYALGLPLLHQPCGVDTEKFDIAQQVIPDGNGGFKYVKGPMIEACEKGFVCEISEADLILKQGTLGEFNPLLDKTGTYPLSTGEIVKRHPDAVLIFTMNADYEGCRNINQAVRNRCQVFQFDTPSDDVLVQRVANESGYDDTETIKKMVDVYHRIKDFCETNSVTDGTVGVRNLVAWATATAINGRPHHNAFSTMVLGATFDREVHGDLMRCIESQFPPEEVNCP